MASQDRRTYDSDFKKNAVNLSMQEGNSVKEVAENLGIKSA